MDLVIGSVYEGKIINITNFGVFVEVCGKTGLVHISEISNRYVKDIKEHLKDVETIKVKVLSIDESGKMSLSIKQAEDKYKSKYEGKKGNNVKFAKETNFEDILSKYLKDSEERMQDFRKSQDSKFRGYGKRNFG